MNVHPIAEVSTSAAAFIGVFAGGPRLEPLRVTSAEDARCRFGEAETDARLALDQFFLNGGEEAWMVRADGDDPGDDLGDDLIEGLRALDAVDLVNILCIPDMRLFERAAAARILAAARDWCAARRAFFIADPREGLSVVDIGRWVEDPAIVAAAGNNVAIYFPDLVLDGGRTVGPSGTMAGIYARTDKEQGVWKAAAGRTSPVRGAIGVSVPVTDAQQNTLLPKGVNCMRSFPAAGILPWGSRVMVRDPEMQYVPLHRLTLFLEESIRRGLAWVVFEPNGPPLWAAITASVAGFLRTLWMRGAFLGDKPEQAFFVRCDATTSDLSTGRLEVIVGVAPQRPAEFVNLHIPLHAKDDE